jgi:hypothetical protein
MADQLGDTAGMLGQLAVSDTQQRKHLENTANGLQRLLGTIRTDLSAAKANAKKVGESHREIIRPLINRLCMQALPDNPLDALDIDRTCYAPVKLVLDCRSAGADPQRLDSLMTMIKEGKDIGDMFRQFDDGVWADLKQAREQIKIDSFPAKEKEAYDIITFKVMPDETPGTNNIGHSYAFNYGFVYKWTIGFGETSLRFWDTPASLMPVTSQPTVTQFIPRTNTTVSASVEVFRSNDDASHNKNGITIAMTPFKTHQNSLLKQLHWLRRCEILFAVVAFATALFGAIETDQFKNALKGSWFAFAALFLWGVAADQIKNAFTSITTSMDG